MTDIYFLVFGCVCIAAGLLICFLKALSLRKCRTRVEAEITSVKVQSIPLRGSKVYTYSPVITYKVDGRTFNGTAPFSSAKKEKYAVGGVLPILVNPSNPGEFRFEGRVGTLFAGGIILAIGLLFFILSFV